MDKPETKTEVKEAMHTGNKPELIPEDFRGFDRKNRKGLTR